MNTGTETEPTAGHCCPYPGEWPTAVTIADTAVLCVYDDPPVVEIDASTPDGHRAAWIQYTADDAERLALALIGAAVKIRPHEITRDADHGRPADTAGRVR